MQIAGFNFAGSNALPFPVAANDPAMAQAGGSTPARGTNAFLSMLSAAFEAPVQPAPTAAGISVPAVSTKERAKDKNTETAAQAPPAIPAAAQRAFTLLSSSSGNSAQAMTFAATAFPLPVPGAASGLVLLAADDKNPTQQSAQQFSGLPARLAPLSQATNNRALASLMFDSGSAARTEIPLAFALQLTAKSSEPSLPEQIPAPADGTAVDNPSGAAADSSPAQLPLASSGFQDVAANLAASASPASYQGHSGLAFMALPGLPSTPATNLVDGAGSAAVAAHDTAAHTAPALSMQGFEIQETSGPTLAGGQDRQTESKTGAANTPEGNRRSEKSNLITDTRPAGAPATAELPQRNGAPTNEAVSPRLPSPASSNRKWGAAENQSINDAIAPEETDRNGTQDENPGLMVPAENPVETGTPESESTTKNSPVTKTEPRAQSESAEKSQQATETQATAKAQSKDAPEDSGDAGTSNPKSDQQLETARASGAGFPLTAGPLSTREPAQEPEQARLSAAEPVAEIADASAARPAPAREISLRLEGADVPSVSIQLSERAGKIDVAVRTGDTQLSRSLQSGLGDLVAQLENHGFKTDAWTPGALRGAAMLHSSSEASLNQQQSGQSGGGSARQEQHSESGSRRQRRANLPFDKALAEEDARTE